MPDTLRDTSFAGYNSSSKNATRTQQLSTDLQLNRCKSGSASPTSAIPMEAGPFQGTRKSTVMAYGLAVRDREPYPGRDT